MKKKISKLIIICSLILSICLTPLIASGAGNSAITAAEESVMTIKFFSDNDKDSNGNLIPDSAGRITVGVGIRKKNDGVSLTVKTRDKSALASENDYESKSQSIQLISTETSGDIEYFTVTAYQTNGANIISGSNEKYGSSRVFEIVLCDISTNSGCDYIIKNDWEGDAVSSYNCRVKTQYDYEYSTKINDSGMYFTDYLYGKSFATVYLDRSGVYTQTPSKKISFSVDNDTNYNFNSKNIKRFISSEYIAKYQETGFADIFYGGSAIISESWWCLSSEPAKLSLTDSNGKEIFYSEYYDPRSSGAPILFGEEGYAEKGNDDYSYDLTGNAKKWLRNNVGYYVYNTEDPMYKHAYCYYSNKNYNFSSVTGKIYKSNSKTLNLSVSRDSTWKMDFDYFRLDSELYDVTAPKIIKTSLDNISLTDNKVLRLSVRFSEPVHFPNAVGFNKDSLTVSARVNNNISDMLEFAYNGGEGTDTLYFDCDLENFDLQKQISKISLSDLAFDNLKGYLFDYACNFNVKNNEADLEFSGIDFDVNIDMRVPEVMVTNASHGITQKSHTVEIKVEDMISDGSKFYYTWVKSTDIEGGDLASYTPTSYDNCETVQPTYFVINEDKLDGNYYLYYMAKSAYGKEAKGYFNYVFHFDNSAVEIDSVDFGGPNSALSKRTLEIKLKGETSDLKRVDLSYIEKGTLDTKTIQLYGTTTCKITSFTYNEGISTAIVELSGVDDLGMGNSENKYFYFSLATEDEVGNRSEKIFPNSYLFDTHDKCSIDMTVNGTVYTVDGKEICEEVSAGSSTTVSGTTNAIYKNTYFAEGFELVFTSSSSSIELYSLYMGDENITEEDANYFTLISSTNCYKMQYVSENGGGYFTIQLLADGKTSDSYSFYLVGENDEVAGCKQTEDSNLVINKLYSVGASSYYYLETSGTVKTEYYNSASDHASLVFSTKARALDYYEYMEKQDLSLVVITADIAKALNDTTHSNTNKAQDETTTAVAGQTWLRYKASSWNQSSDSSEWVYYYYSQKSEAQIDQTKLSQNLRNAIKSVATKIVQSGNFIYLTSDEGLNSVNMPEVAVSRIRAESKSASITKSGIPFKTPIGFVGDSEVYSSKYVIDTNSYVYSATKLNASNYTIIKYKNHDSEEYETLNVGSSYYLKDLIKGTGVYDIVERDENGARKYSVYIDNSAPQIKVSYKMNNEKADVIVNESYAKTMGMLYVKNFNFISIEDSDDYAYVAIFSTSNGTSKGSLYGAYLKNEINGVSLTNGGFIVEVCDRLGNMYSFVVNVSTENYADDCEISNVTNSYLRFTYKFQQDYIDIFEVYHDGVLMYDKAAISTSLKNSINFTTAGEYRFYVKDKFGNVFEKTETFVIELPKVLWYFEQNGTSVLYNETGEQVGILVKQLGATTYMVTSKTDVKFRFLKENLYKCEFLSGSGTMGTVSKYNEVTIAKTDENQNWQVKIYYEEYPDICITYLGKFDDAAPTISVMTSKTVYEYADEDDEKIADYLEKNKGTLFDGDIINWTDVSISNTTSTTESIAFGSTVSGSVVSVNVSDLSDIYKWTCSFNGKTTEYESNKMVFNREGSYVITAMDMLGNESTFSFNIGKSEFTDIECDDVIPANYDAVNYNKENVIAILDGEGSFSFIVNGEYFNLVTNGDNTLTRVIKRVKKNGDDIFIEDVKEIFDLGSKVTIKETSTYTISASLSNETIYIVIAIKDDTDERLSVKIRVNSYAGTDAKYAEFELSKEFSYLKYEIEGENEEDLTENLYISKQCTVKKTGDVTSIIIFYSETDDSIADCDIVYSFIKDDTLTEYVCEDEGYYTLWVTNKYGNMSVIKIVYNTKVPVVASVKFSDDETISYSTDYSGELYSNQAVSIKVYNNTKVKITKGGVEYQPDNKLVVGDSVTYTVASNGEYIFTITDIYGNIVTRTAYIQTNSISYVDSWLSGFNENSLGKKEGYTNTKVSFNENTLKNSIYYISVIFNGETTKIYDAISENKIEFADYQVGNDGDGEYSIIFRDQFGNKALKSVFYRESSPLLVSTLSRSLKKLFVELDSDVIEVWNNKNITFDCPENNYEYKLTVDGINMGMPYTLAFPNESNYGKFTHTVSYIDQYGFTYTFNCVLYRTTIEVDDSSMTIANSTTKDPICISFNSEYNATISLNGENLGTYESGKNYFMDGSYIISVYDRAGNINNYAIKRDSIADFCFYTDSKDNQLINGEITNESIVYFAPLNGDSVSYYTVYHDGREENDYDLTAFNESGKWEVVLIDEIGNKDYFCFYIITHSISTFNYIVPSGFTVSEATFDSGAGKIDWIECIKENAGRYELDFEDSGTYNIVMVSDITGKTSDFELTIDKSVPNIKLSGVENGGTTKNNVKITGVKSGDVVYIYKNGTLNKTIDVVTSSDVPEISEKGEYKIVVVNEAGGSIEVEFTRLYTANVVTSVLIILSILVVSAGLFTGLLFRKRSRIE